MRSLLAVLLCAFLAACSLRGGQNVVPSPTFAMPQVVQQGNGSSWKQINTTGLSNLFTSIIEGPDGNMWFLDENLGSLVRMTMSGSTKVFHVGGFLYDFAVGSDKHFYVNDGSTNIYRVSTGGMFTSYSIPSGDSTALDGIAAGPDGNVWFAEFKHIAKITTAGKITEFLYPNQASGNGGGGVTAGPDGNVWFSEDANNEIGRIVPSTGTIKEFPIPVGCGPTAIMTAKDNNLWFVCSLTMQMIGQITKTGVITMYSLGYSESGNYTTIVGRTGPDGEPWFASANCNCIYRIDTTKHTMTTFTAPFSGERPDSVGAGPDGNVWATTISTGHIDVRVLHPMTVSPTSITFSGMGQKKNVTVSEGGVSNWTATTSNPAVAIVAPGSNNSTFVVTSVGTGKCTIKIADAVGNFVNVKVTVT